MNVNRLTGGPDAGPLGPVFGVEVEFEHVYHPYEVMEELRLGGVGEAYRLEEDGSLRNMGAEFVSEPLTIGQLEAPTRALWQHSIERQWTGGPRCGIHLHMNMRDYTMEQLRSIITAYAAVEPAIFLECGEEREANIFCVPWYRACDADLINMVLEMGEGDRTEMILTLRQICKYTAMNLAPLAVFGTIEFRGAPVYRSADQVLALMSAFQNMIERSRDMDPEDIVLQTEDNPRELLQHLWPSQATPRAARLLNELDTVGSASRFVCTKAESWESIVNANEV